MSKSTYSLNLLLVQVASHGASGLIVTVVQLEVNNNFKLPLAVPVFPLNYQDTTSNHRLRDHAAAHTATGPQIYYL